MQCVNEVTLHYFVSLSSIWFISRQCFDIVLSFIWRKVVTFVLRRPSHDVFYRHKTGLPPTISFVDFAPYIVSLYWYVNIVSNNNYFQRDWTNTIFYLCSQVYTFYSLVCIINIFSKICNITVQIQVYNEGRTIFMQLWQHFIIKSILLHIELDHCNKTFFSSNYRSSFV